MVKPVIGIPTSDWQIEIAYSGAVGAGLHADASLWRFYSPQLSFAFAVLALGGGLGAAIGASFDIDGTTIANQIGAAAGGGLNQTLTIHQPFRCIDMDGASLNELSIGVSALAELSGRDFTVRSARGTRLFSFNGADLGFTMGAEVNILKFTHLAFLSPFEVPVSRWDALRESRRPASNPT